MIRTSDLIKPLDLDQWVRDSGGYWRIDWKAWDRECQRMQAARRADLPKLVKS